MKLLPRWLRSLWCSECRYPAVMFVGRRGGKVVSLGCERHGEIPLSQREIASYEDGVFYSPSGETQ